MPSDEQFNWQARYGVLTFGHKALPMVMGYVDRQKVHRAEGTLQPYLERIHTEE